MRTPEFRSAPHRGVNLILLSIFILQFSLPATGIRKDVSFRPKLNCNTTVQGRYYLTDDKGYVCDAFSTDPVSHCCPERGDQFSCQGCKIVSQCCNSYEFCVSCCLNPEMTHKELALKVKIAKPVTAGVYGSTFNYCAGRCRHNSESVVHENAYLSEFHHCFSIPSNSSESFSTQLESRLAGINVIIGRQGESCDSACKSKGHSCVPNKLAVLNQCEVIKKYMSCKGSCLSSVGADQPAEVVDDAPSYLIYSWKFYSKTLVHACIREGNLHFLVMARTVIQGGFALAHELSCLHRDDHELIHYYFPAIEEDQANYKCIATSHPLGEFF